MFHRKVILAILVIFSLLFLKFIFSTPNENFDILDKQTQNRLLKDMSQKAVLSRLKAPSTAKFPGSTEYFIKFVRYSKDYDSMTYKVNSYVDAQNSFGAVIRSNYEVVLQINKIPIKDKGEFSYRVISCDFNTF